MSQIWTESQKQVYSQITTMLSEHFDAFVLVTMVQGHDPVKGEVTNAHMSFDGGVFSALGLLEKGKMDLSQVISNNADRH